MVEGAQIGKPHPTAGERTNVFVTTKHYQQKTPDLIKRLQDHVLQKLSKIAVPQEIEVVPLLPKTRSGKIMRLVLKTKELSQDPGDISTLEERVLISCDSLFDQCFYLGPLTLNQRTAQSFIRKFRRQISWEL